MVTSLFVETGEQMAAQSKEKKTLLLYMLYKRQQKKKRRRCWVHKIVSLRSKEGEFATLFAKLRINEIKFYVYVFVIT